jgi:hypothetical protein
MQVPLPTSSEIFPFHFSMAKEVTKLMNQIYVLFFPSPKKEIVHATLVRCFIVLNIYKQDG